MLIIIRGTPGSGKSTLAKNIINSTTNMLDFVHLEADMFYNDIENNYIWDASKIKYAHEWCQKTCMEMLKQGFDVIISNTFTTLKEMEPYLELGKSFHAYVKVYKCVGEYGSIHNVPEETLKKMKDRWQDYAGEIVVDKDYIYG